MLWNTVIGSVTAVLAAALCLVVTLVRRYMTSFWNCSYFDQSSLATYSFSVLEASLEEISWQPIEE